MYYFVCPRRSVNEIDRGINRLRLNRLIIGILHMFPVITLQESQVAAGVVEF